MILTLFIIEILILQGLVRLKKSISHPFVIVFFTAFFYLNAPLLDHYFLGLRLTRYLGPYIDFKSDTVLYYCYYKFLFIISFFFLLGRKSKGGILYFKKNQYTFKVKKKAILLILLLMLSVYNFNNILVNSINTREVLSDNQTPFSLIMRNFSNYLFIILFCLRVKKTFLYKLFIISSILYFFISFEREPLVILFFCLIYTNKTLIKPQILILSSIGLIFTLYLWKVIYSSFLYQTGGGVDVVKKFYEKEVFSFSGLDPGSSFRIFYEYLEGTIRYDDYYFSYVIGMAKQVERMIFVSDYQTLAEYSSVQLVNGRFGVAFSFLLESVLNFSVLGPLVISFLIFTFIKQGLKFQNKFGAGIVVCCIYIILKLMRTEIATIVKLELFPLTLVLLLLLLLFKKKVDIDYEC